MAPLRTTLAAIGLLTTPLSAEVGIGVRVRPDDRAVAEGDTASVEVRVASNTERLGTPELKLESDGELDIQRVGSGSSFSFQIGRTTRSDVTHEFAVRGKAGTYTLRATVRDQAGKLHQSEPVVVRFRPPTAAERAMVPELRIVAEKPSCYAGEELAVDLLLVVRPETGFRLERGNTPEIAIDAGTLIADGPAVLGSPIDGMETIRFPYRLTTLKPGPLPLEAKFTPLMSVRGRTGRVEGRRYAITSSPATIEVKPLPTSGRPEGFNGAVGQFELTVAADPLKLKVGEPLALRLAVTGKGNFDSLTAPLPTLTEGWRFYKADAMDIQRGEDAGAPDRLVFAQNAVPQRPISELPPFRLPVFDPVEERYEVLLTAPVPISVEGTALAESPSPPKPVAPETSAPSQAPSARTEPQEMEDILLAPDALKPRWGTPAMAAPWRQHRFWWLTGGGVAGVLALAAALRIASARPAPPKAPDFATLLRAAEAAPARAAPFYAAAHACLRGAPAGSVPDAEPLRQIAERHEFLQFAGDPDAGGTPLPADERARVLAALRALAG